MGNCAGGAKSFSELNSSVLDRVTSRTSSEDDCLLYRLADYQRGGELVNFFQKEGSRSTEELLREQIPLLLYQKGEGRIVTRSDYLKWKYRNLPHVALPINESTPNWKDHLACWNFEFRGSLGESLLHVLIVCDSKKHTRLAKMLIKCFPKLALDIVEGDEFRGASGLHLAIAYNNMELVKELVEAGANITQRATGSFFLPKDLQKSPPVKQTNYEGLAYFGEYPLAWAACCGNESAYNLLVDRGADPNSQDTLGNMVLHMVVVCDKLEMYGYALRHPRQPAKMALTNAAGLTPLTLACHLGRATIFREMLELTAREFWRYSNITCSAYPLNALDTILPDGRSNWNSALMIILNGTKEEHLDMLDGGIIQRLLEEKWKTFARNQFLKRLGIQFFYLFALSMAVYLRPSSSEPLMVRFDDLDVTNIVRFCFEMITILNCLSFIVIQQLGELRNQGLGGFLRQLASDPAKSIFLISNLLTLACIPCRLAGDRATEEAILIFSLPCAWFFLMFFAGAIRLTGPFVTMIYSMVTGDMLTFAIIYTVFLLGFSQAIFYLHKGHPEIPVYFESYLGTWMGLFQWTLGTYNFDALGQTPHAAMSLTVFVIFMIMVPILLLNMLIAMMGNTYAQVIQQSEKEFVKQWAKIVVSLERSVKQSDAKQYLEEYSIKLPNVGGGDDGDEPPQEVIVRGVMVIKSKNKTRARQRKGALGNWKRVGKFTINYLKKRGISGEALRMEIWHPHSAANSTTHSPSHGLLSSNQAMTMGFAEDAMDAISALAFQSKMAAPAPPPVNTKTDAFGGMSKMLEQLSFANDINPTGEAPVEAVTTPPVGTAPMVLTGPTPVVLPQQNVSVTDMIGSAPGHTTAPVAVVPPQKSSTNPPFSSGENAPVNAPVTPVPFTAASPSPATVSPTIRTVTRSTSMDAQSILQRQDSITGDTASALSDIENELIAQTLLNVHNMSASSSVDMEADGENPHDSEPPIVHHECRHNRARHHDERHRRHERRHDRRDRDERRRDACDKEERKHGKHGREDREDRERVDRKREDRNQDDSVSYREERKRDDRNREERKREKRKIDKHGREARLGRDNKPDARVADEEKMAGEIQNRDAKNHETKERKEVGRTDTNVARDSQVYDETKAKSGHRSRDLDNKKDMKEVSKDDEPHNDSSETKQTHGFSIQRMMEQRRGSCPSYIDDNQSDGERQRWSETSQRNLTDQTSNKPNRYMFTHRPRIVIDLEQNRSLTDGNQMFSQSFDDKLLGVQPGAPPTHQPPVKSNNGKSSSRLGRRTNVISPMETKPPVLVYSEPAVIENNIYNNAHGQFSAGPHKDKSISIQESENESIISDGSSNSGVHETLFTAVTVPSKRPQPKMMSSSSCDSDRPIYHISGNMKSGQDVPSKHRRKDSKSNNGSSSFNAGLNRMPSLSANGKSSRHPTTNKSSDKMDPEGKHGRSRPLTSTNTRISQAKANHFKAPRDQVSVIAWEDNEDNPDLDQEDENEVV